MRGNSSTEDEPGYHQLLHGSSSPRRSLRLFASRPPAGFGKRGLDGDRALILDLVPLDTVRSVRVCTVEPVAVVCPKVQTRCASPTPLPSSVSVEDAGSKLSDAAADVRIAKEISPNFADDAVGLVARTVLYAFPQTNAFDVRQMIDSNSTNVRIFSRYRHNTMC